MTTSSETYQAMSDKRKFQRLGTTSEMSVNAFEHSIQYTSKEVNLGKLQFWFKMKNVMITITPSVKRIKA